MSNGRQAQKGSFAGHFDELVAQFVASETPTGSVASSSEGRSRQLQEKIDIHALLFERAWQVDGEP